MAGEHEAAAALRRRLGVAGAGGSRDLRALAGRLGGEEPQAVVLGMWDRRAWAIAATERELVLVRRPRLFGRARDEAFRWTELGAVRVNTMGLELEFAGQTVSLVAAGPQTELERLIAAARRHAEGGGEPSQSAEDLRELARRKLGRFVGFGFEGTVEALPDRLEPGERVERLAAASLEFDGLLVLTDRRLVLFSLGLRSGSDRLWAVDRAEIRGARAAGTGMELDLPSGPVELKLLRPPGRLEELLAVLGAP